MVIHMCQIKSCLLHLKSRRHPLTLPPIAFGAGMLACSEARHRPGATAICWMISNTRAVLRIWSSRCLGKKFSLGIVYPSLPFNIIKHQAWEHVDSRVREGRFLGFANSRQLSPIHCLDCKSLNKSWFHISYHNLS